MKRSEMLELMASNLYIWNNMGADTLWEELNIEAREMYLDQAGLLLSLQEFNGMLPPTRTERSVLPGLSDFKINKWEPEDDAK